MTSRCFLGCSPARSALGPRKLRLAFQRTERLVIHVPLLQNGENSLHREAGPRQLPENARRLLLIFRFFQPLLAQKFTSLLFVAHALVCGLDSLFDHISFSSALLNVRDYTVTS